MSSSLEEILMCHAKQCRKCGKVTWAGCGQHVDQVMRNVPRSDRCAGHEDEPREPGRLMAWVRRDRS